MASSTPDPNRALRKALRVRRLIFFAFGGRRFRARHLAEYPEAEDIPTIPAVN